MHHYACGCGMPSCAGVPAGKVLGAALLLTISPQPGPPVQGSMMPQEFLMR
jgi:hypothetical protein